MREFLNKNRKEIWVFLLMASASFAAFHVTFPGGFVSDDFDILTIATNSSFPKLLTSPGWLFVRPLPLCFVKFETLLFGRGPLGYWMVSILNHAVNGLMLFLLTRRISGDFFSSVAAGLIFIFMPIFGEPVAWFSCIYDRICLFFVLAGIIAYIRYLDTGDARNYIFSLIFFVIALFSKEAALPFPGLVVLTEAFFCKKAETNIKKVALRVAPFVLVLLPYFLLRYYIYHGIGGYYDTQGRSTLLLFSAAQTVQALSSLPGYLLFPINRLLRPNLLSIYIGFGALYALLAVSAVFLSSHGWGLKPMLFGLIWMAATVVPVVNLLPLSSGLAGGRLLYIPAAGFAIFMSSFFLTAKKWPWFSKALKFAPLVALLCGYSYIDNINYSIWTRAYSIAHSITSQVFERHPVLPAETSLYFIGVPDNFDGAYVYHNCLEEAINLTYGYNGSRHVKVFCRDDDGSIRGEPTTNFDDMMRKGGKTVYVFNYSELADKLVQVYPGR